MSDIFLKTLHISMVERVFPLILTLTMFIVVM